MAGALIEVDDLPSTVIPTRQHVLPAMADGFTVRLAVAQILGLIAKGDFISLFNAGDVAFNPSGSIASATVQAALAEVDSEKFSIVSANASLAARADGRLTLTSNTAVTTADVTAAATLYYTPYKGNRIGLYVSGAWVPHTFIQTSLSLSGLTAAKPYDIFAYSNSGTLALEALVWTDDTTRATALASQDGIYVKNGDLTRRYIGTIYTSATGQCEDSAAKRYVWNMYNRVSRAMTVIDTTDSWTYTTDTWRQARGSSTNQLDFVRGLDEDEVIATCQGLASNGTAGSRGNTGIGIDSATVASGLSSTLILNSAASSLFASCVSTPGIGRHTLKWLERASAIGTCTWYGDGGLADRQAGILGRMMA